MSPKSRRSLWGAVFVSCVAIAAFGRRHFHGPLGWVFTVAAAAFFLFKMVRGLVAAFARIRSAKSQSIGGVALWKEIIPPWIRGVAATEAKIYLEVLSHFLRFRPPSDRLASHSTDGTRFSLARGDIYQLLPSLAVIGLLSDFPLAWVLVAIIKPDHTITVHLILLGLALWGGVWIAGDTFAVRALPHLVTRNRIALRVGFRWSCDIPVDAVLRCLPLKGKSKSWLPKLQLDASQVWIVTPIDPPNVLIEIKAFEARQVSISRMGARVQGRQHVAVYVDDARLFISCIEAVLECRKERVDA
jgi:hypothetical protein